MNFVCVNVCLFIQFVEVFKKYSCFSLNVHCSSMILIHLLSINELRLEIAFML